MFAYALLVAVWFVGAVVCLTGFWENRDVKRLRGPQPPRSVQSWSEG